MNGKWFGRLALVVLGLAGMLAMVSAGAPWVRIEDFQALEQRVDNLEATVEALDARLDALEGGGGGGGRGQCEGQPDGTPCDDGDACTTNSGDVCSSGVCVGGAPVLCDDGVSCTNDSCVSGVGCEYSPDNNQCIFANGIGACAETGCALVACNAGFSNCDGDPTNGCEALGACS